MRAEPCTLLMLPLLCLSASAWVGWQKRSALYGAIEQDRTYLEYGQRRAATDRIMIDDRGQTAVGVDAAIFGGQMVARQHVHLEQPVRQPDLFEHDRDLVAVRSEEHTSELQSLMRISYAVFCLKKKHTIQSFQRLIFNPH